jgi:hypothetical protein
LDTGGQAAKHGGKIKRGTCACVFWLTMSDTQLAFYVRSKRTHVLLAHPLKGRHPPCPSAAPTAPGFPPPTLLAPAPSCLPPWPPRLTGSMLLAVDGESCTQIGLLACGRVIRDRIKLALATHSSAVTGRPPVVRMAFADPVPKRAMNEQQSVSLLRKRHCPRKQARVGVMDGRRRHAHAHAHTYTHTHSTHT